MSQYLAQKIDFLSGCNPEAKQQLMIEYLKSFIQIHKGQHLLIWHGMTHLSVGVVC